MPVHRVRLASVRSQRDPSAPAPSVAARAATDGAGADGSRCERTDARRTRCTGMVSLLETTSGAADARPETATLGPWADQRERPARGGRPR